MTLLLDQRMCPDCGGLHTGGAQRDRPCDRPSYAGPRLCARRGCQVRLDPLLVHLGHRVHPWCAELAGLPNPPAPEED